MINKNLYEKYHNNLKLQKRIIGSNDFTYRNIIESIKKYIPTKGSVLDIGSATGTLSLYFGSRGLNVVGIELSKNAFKYANLNKDKLNVSNVDFVNISIENFKSSRRYNLITCFEVLEHLENDIEILRKVLKYMDRNSILAISVPSINAPLHRLGLLKKFDEKVGHLRRYSFDSIKKTVQVSGFKVIDYCKSEGVVRNLIFTNNFFGTLGKLTRFRLVNNIVSFFDLISIRLFGESQLILICKKI